MDYIIRSCDFPKKEILMAYLSNFLVINFQKKNFLIDYVTRSCDLLEPRKQVGLQIM